MPKHSQDAILLTHLKRIGTEINAVIDALEPHEELENRIAYARFITSVFGVLIKTIPLTSRYDLYEMVDVATETVRAAQPTIN